MIGKSPNQDQKHLFLPNLTEFINPRHELCRLAGKIDWDFFETEFAPLYSTVGCPAKPVRLMAGLLILKNIHQLSDESVVENWVSNPYFQFFCGEAVFQWQTPCDPSDLVHFRHRIGEDGVGKILERSEAVGDQDDPEEDQRFDSKPVGSRQSVEPAEAGSGSKLIETWRQFKNKFKKRY